MVVVVFVVVSAVRQAGAQTEVKPECKHTERARRRSFERNEANPQKKKSSDSPRSEAPFEKSQGIRRDSSAGRGDEPLLALVPTCL